MSNSKFIMARKLHSVQESLMACEIKDDSLDFIIPLIFKECSKQKLTFWFNVFENEVVLNLHDVEQENYELNFRQYHEPANKLDDCKIQVLYNAFLLNHEKIVSSAKEVASNKSEQLIITGDKPTPPHIREAIKKIQAKGIPVTVEAIQNHLPLGQMSTSSRIECNTYLKNMMEASE